MKTVNTLSLALILLMEISAMEDGINTEQKKTMDFANHALKFKKKKIWESRKTLTSISCLTAKDLVNKKI